MLCTIREQLKYVHMYMYINNYVHLLLLLLLTLKILNSDYILLGTYDLYFDIFTLYIYILLLLYINLYAVGLRR